MKDFAITTIICLTIAGVILGVSYMLIKQKAECLETMREYDPLAIQAVCGRPA